MAGDRQQGAARNPKSFCSETRSNSAINVHDGVLFRRHRIYPANDMYFLSPRYKSDICMTSHLNFLLDFPSRIT